MILINALLGIYAQEDQQHRHLLLLVVISAALENSVKGVLLLKLIAQEGPTTHMLVRLHVPNVQLEDFVHLLVFKLLLIVQLVNIAWLVLKLLLIVQLVLIILELIYHQPLSAYNVIQENIARAEPMLLQVIVMQGSLVQEVAQSGTHLQHLISHL